MVYEVLINSISDRKLEKSVVIDDAVLFKLENDTMEPTLIQLIQLLQKEVRLLRKEVRQLKERVRQVEGVQVQTRCAANDINNDDSG